MLSECIQIPIFDQMKEKIVKICQENGNRKNFEKSEKGPKLKIVKIKRALWLHLFQAKTYLVFSYSQLTSNGSHYKENAM